MYAITWQEASVAPQIITGMVSFLGHDVYALIDSGATHSFTFYQLVHWLRLPYDNRSSALCGCEDTVRRECNSAMRGKKKNCLPKVREVEIRVSLVVMPIQDPDLILGME